MSIFNLHLKDIITIKNDFQELDLETTLITLHYNRLPNIYTLVHNVYSDKFWEFLKTNFVIKNENINVKIDMSVDIKNREQKFYQYLIHIEDPDIYLSFYDEEKNFDDDDYLELVDEADKLNKVGTIKIYFNFDKNEYITDTLIPELKKIIHTPNIKNQFFVISASDRGGFELRGNYIRKMNIDVALNYGDVFEKKYASIVESLKENNTGLYLFHGESGTGKTTFIRKLISELSETKTFIYVPSYLMFELSNPELISFISKYKESILILEDAENVLTNAMSDRTQAVANILNISDGLLNDAVSIQIIATFNVEKKIIDEALTRPGRLKVNHKFKALTVDESNRLAEHLKIEKRFKRPTVVANIYEKPSEDLVDTSEYDNKTTGFKYGANKDD